MSCLILLPDGKQPVRDGKVLCVCVCVRVSEILKRAASQQLAFDQFSLTVFIQLFTTQLWDVTDISFATVTVTSIRPPRIHSLFIYLFVHLQSATEAISK